MELLIISNVWVEPASSAAGTRMLQLIKLFESFGYQVHYASTASESAFAIDSKALQIEVHEIRVNDPSFDDLLRVINPDIVLFDRFMTEEQFGWRVAEHCPDTIRVLDTEDLHCLRNAREVALKEGRSFRDEDLNRTIAYREIAAILRCDLSLIISSYEMVLLQRYFNIDPQLLHYIPLLFKVDELTERTEFPTFHARAHFLTIGNFRHHPNVDAVKYIKQEIWPELSSRLPNAHMHIYGAYPSNAILQLHDEHVRFLIKGRAISATEVISKSRVMLAPLRFGAGIKGKLLDAMITGTPSVTTSIGEEGIGLEKDWPGSLADTPEELIEQAFRLYTDEDIWNQAQHKALPLLKSNFDWDQHAVLFERRLTKLLRDYRLERSVNFAGKMLQHHFTKSTELMAKWIQEKNKGNRNEG